MRTAAPLRDAAVIGLGINVTLHDRITLFTEYELEPWKASYFEQTVNAGARVSFQPCLNSREKMRGARWPCSTIRHMF